MAADGQIDQAGLAPPPAAGPWDEETARFLAEERTRILSAWEARGPGVVLLIGTAGSGKTALLEDLAATFRQTGQVVHFARRGDRATLPSGAAVLLIDEAARMPDLLLHRLFDRNELFCVLADQPGFLERLQAIGVAAKLMNFGGAAAAPQPRRWLPILAAVASAGVLVAVVLGALHRDDPPTLPEPSAFNDRASGLARPPPAPPVQTRPGDAVPAAPPAAASIAPLPEQPASPPPPVVEAEPPPLPAPTPEPAETASLTAPVPPPALVPPPAAVPPPAMLPPAAIPPAQTEPNLPAVALPFVSLSYAAGDASGGALARQATLRLREAGVNALDPGVTGRVDRSAIRYHFEQDRPSAEAVRSRLDTLLPGLQVEPAPVAAGIRPGQIDISITGSAGRPAGGGYDAVVRARRVSAQEPRPR